MINNNHNSYCFLLVGMAASASASASDFFDDSEATLTARNYYMDREYKGTSPQNHSREWAQGFILKANSGYTDGPVGFGLNATGLMGIKLDSSPDRRGTDLLPYNAQGEAADEYSELGLTAKMRLAKTVVQAGTLTNTTFPMAYPSVSRLLPQTFRGVHVSSTDLDKFTLIGSYIDRINKRNSTDYEKFTMGSPNGRYNPTAESDKATFLGIEYRPTNAWTLRYYNGTVENLYQTNYINLENLQNFENSKLKSEVSWYSSRDEGSAGAGKVDNDTYLAEFTYSVGGHSFIGGYQILSGDTATPYISGTEMLTLGKYMLASDFLNPNERTWQAMYVYDFVASGIPGLKATVRYLKGDDIELPTALGGSGLSESERYVELSYVIQSGPLRDVAIRVRNSKYRNDFASNASFRDENQTRINIDYTVKLW
ncbi:OprD family porin [Pseudomonas sp. BN605]|uniref:Outer membrane porin, OprD family n=1 Tax=Pseudomonas hunanensis TaxID=1247546 RepID=A0ABD6MWV4_9PSED|nr:MULTISPECIES: OprD family outer membrane porin [Pseudomonas]MDH4847947.1 OprD family porin [Pseudomonas sp. BN605]NWL45624.1 outer membrane porin, OprD family [Pseudomonas hunanensis]